ncbi:alkyl/aryl-sulfatase [Photobacterium sp. R1]
MKFRKSVVFLSIALVSQSVFASMEITPESKPASAFTIEKNDALRQYLNFEDREDFNSASRGFIATWPYQTIQDKDGQVVWDFDAFQFVNSKQQMDTINPSLLRMAQLNNKVGLFQVTEGIYLIRGFDLSVMSFIRGEKGWIVVDPLISEETARAGLALLNQYVENLPVTAVVFTHSHIDHFGGIWGVTTKDAYQNGQVEVVAPEGFFEHAISENVLAGNLMSRRASFMYGNLAERGPRGLVDAGLGKTTSTGIPGIVEPTLLIHKTGEKHRIDGIEFDFQMANGSEAPAEFMAYMPKYKTLLASEVMTHTIHNISTLRGAQTRDASKWAAYVDETIHLYGDKADTMIASHHWPTWGQAKIKDQLEKTRDMYKYVHDQTLRLANMGYTPNEISSKIQLPESLDKAWFNRGYYGSVSHNARATYDFYFGAWWDGNPANLNPLPPEDAGAKYVEAMGGAGQVIEIAKKAVENGEYRWAVTLLNHVVFADPTHKEARYLEADAMEQLGYQAESGPWRNYYLIGAKELREGFKSAPTPDTTAIAKNMPVSSVLEAMTVRVNPEKAAGKTFTINLKVTGDTDSRSGEYSMLLSNAVLKTYQDRQLENPDITLVIEKSDMVDLLTRKASLESQIKAGKLKVNDGQKFADFMAIFDTFRSDFGIVTP